MAWHDCYGDLALPQDVVDDIFIVGGRDLSLADHLASGAAPGAGGERIHRRQDLRRLPDLVPARRGRRLQDAGLLEDLDGATGTAVGDAERRRDVVSVHDGLGAPLA